MRRAAADAHTVTLRADQVHHFTPVSYDAADVALAADLEPAGAVAGDGLDYHLEDDLLTFAVFDAMGNDRRSAELVADVMAAYRQTRPEQMSLPATAVRLDRVVAEECDGESYCTGVLAELDILTGQLRTLNAGHPSSLLLNLPSREYQPIATVVNLPFGLSVLLDEVPAPVVNKHHLQPGQFVVAYTDGVTEARSSNRELLGERRFAETLIQSLARGLCPAEAVTQMMRFLHVLQDGSLRDDATLLLVQWRGPGSAAG